MLGCLLRFAWLMLLPKAVLVAKLLAAESQLVACVYAVNRRKAPGPRSRPVRTPHAAEARLAHGRRGR